VEALAEMELSAKCVPQAPNTPVSAAPSMPAAPPPAMC